MTDPDDMYFLGGVAIDGNVIVAAVCCANAVVVFNMETGTSVVHEVGGGGNGYSGACFDGKDIWLSPRHDGPIVRWNPETRACKEYKDFPDGFVGAKYGFGNILYANDCIWLLPFAANLVLKVDVHSDSISAADMIQGESENENQRISNDFIMSLKLGNTIYAHTNTSNMFIAYDTENGHPREEAVPMPDEARPIAREAGISAFYKDAAACESIYDCYYYESQFVTLHRYIDSMTLIDDRESAGALRDTAKKIFRGNISCPNGDSGTSVYEHCRKSIFG
jgi:hypothetical protein